MSFVIFFIFIGRPDWKSETKRHALTLKDCNEFFSVYLEIISFNKNAKLSSSKMWKWIHRDFLFKLNAIETLQMLFIVGWTRHTAQIARATETQIIKFEGKKATKNYLHSNLSLKWNFLHGNHFVPKIILLIIFSTQKRCIHIKYLSKTFSHHGEARERRIEKNTNFSVSLIAKPNEAN